MKNLTSVYQSKIDENQIILKSVKQKLLVSSMVRLITFLLAAVLVYFYFENSIVTISVILGWIILFLFLLSKHSDLKNKKFYLETQIKINADELSALRGDLSPFSNGSSYKDPNHYFSYDIDLFGENSFFHHLNRTKRKESEVKLARILSENSISDITEKQQAVEELKAQLEWRQNYAVNTALIQSKVSSEAIMSWLKAYQPFIVKPLYYLGVVFPLISVSVFVLYFLNIIPELGLFYMLLVGLGITSIQLKKINLLSHHVSEFKDVMSQYAKILVAIENQNFKSNLLQKMRSEIIHDQSLKASGVLSELSKHISALDQRNNMLFGVIGNGFLLWDIKQVFKIEKWIQTYALDIEKWFTVIEDFEALNSLANFAFNHPDFVYPKIGEGDIIEAKKLGHFMIDDSKRVNNDVVIKKNNFIIITGANMAGKSTFLRTVAINIVSANIGLPVCAKAFNYNPIKLITSMRTSDSLLDDESYFFSELKRLKFIVNEIKQDEYFIILDEILKGTNSKDKEEGSKQFVRKLVSSNSTGIIATHDLGLCKISDELPQVINRYFDAEIKNDELFFDYTYKEGVCQNMNASFLLKKMEIV
ncbi:MAG: MutS-related protein [Putridiphycobacter sp.]